MNTYYIVCWAGGPVSVRLLARTEETAMAEFRAMTAEQCRQFIDDGRTDVEDDLDIEAGLGSTYSEYGFDCQLRKAGAFECCSLSDAQNAYNMRGQHLQGDWCLWRV